MSDNSTALVLDWPSIESRMYGVLGCPFCTYNTAENSEAVRRGIEMGGSLHAQCDHHKAASVARASAREAAIAVERELLTKAARAVGFRLVTSAPYGGRPIVTHGGKAFGWNPLDDDRDALRLAVQLRMEIAPEVYAPGVVEIYLEHLDPVSEPIGDDVFAATRRAIVRAAASMPQVTP